MAPSLPARVLSPVPVRATAWLAVARLILGRRRFRQQRLDQTLDPRLAHGIEAAEDLTHDAAFVDEQHRGQTRYAVGRARVRLPVDDDGVTHAEALGEHRRRFRIVGRHADDR